MCVGPCVQYVLGLRSAHKAISPVLEMENSAMDQSTTERPESSSEAGYRGSVACQAAGISYRQLDYWARTGLVVPSVRSAAGSGSARLYSFRDILVLKVIKRFLSAGVSLQNIRSAVEHLKLRGSEDLSTITLMSDGSSIYECTNSDEVYDLLQGGQGVFGIAIGRVWNEVEGSLVALRDERSHPGFDELSVRRQARLA